MSLRDQLQAIYNQRGQMTPQILVEEAQPEEHPLHSRFEWDDTIAGPKYREIQAAELIRSVKITYQKTPDDTPKTVRAWVAPRAEERPHVYEPVEKVAADPDQWALFLRQMEREWQALRRRYAEFEEFWELIRSDAGDRAA